MGTSHSETVEMKDLESQPMTNEGNGETSREEKTFPYNGDDLLESFVDDKVKKLWEACQKPDLESILDDLSEDTLKKTVEVVDKNEMNIFHVLLFEPKDQDQVWYTKNLGIESRKKVVTFIDTICKEIPKEVIEPMMILQDNYNRTPLHYAGIIDDEADEKEESNITLALLKHGADKGLFIEDKNQETPVSFVRTSNLKALLDTKQRNQGPIGHKDRVVHCDVSILQPKNPVTQTTTYPLNWENLEALAHKHKDLFDHQVISAMIW